MNMNKNTEIPERYFIYNYALEEVLVEVTQEVFNETEGETTTERHTVFENGVNQICHTKI